MLTLDTLKELQKAEITEALRLAIAGAEVAKGPVALPDNFKLQSLEQFAANRYRARGTMATKNVADFAKYLESEGQDDGSRVFVDADAMRATAILNFTSDDGPGHCDNTATLTLEKTAAFAKLLQMDGSSKSQLDAAEFFEDFAPALKFFGKDADGNSIEIAVPKAVAAVRKLSLESSKKLESEKDQLSASKSTFDSVRVANDLFPSHVYFECIPYHGLASRTFVLRIGVITTGPNIVLRSIQMEQYKEDMAQEFVAVIADKASRIPVITGTYKTAP